MNKIEARKYVIRKSKFIKEANLKLWQEIIINKIEQNQQFKNAKTVGIYYPINKEFNLTSLIEKHPQKIFYFPKTINKDLIFINVKNLSELVDGPFGLKEPPLTGNKAENIDVYLVPCVASTNNYRIGHGAGFYDYYFSNNKGYKIGIVHPLFKDLKVETNEHDIPMDEIL